MSEQRGFMNTRGSPTLFPPVVVASKGQGALLWGCATALSLAPWLSKLAWPLKATFLG